LYYEPVKKISSQWDLKLLNKLNDIYSERLVTALGDEVFTVGRKLGKSAMEYIGIKAIYPKHKMTKVINTSSF